MPVSRTFDQFGRRINQDETFKKKPNQSPTRNYQKSYFDTVSSTNKPTQMPTNDISPRSSQSMKRTTSFDNFNSLENTTKRPSQKFNEIRKKEVIVTTDSSVTHGSVRMIKKHVIMFLILLRIRNSLFISGKVWLRVGCCRDPKYQNRGFRFFAPKFFILGGRLFY